MGINPTPTNHRSFTFDGKSTREFGVYTTGKDVFNSPERAVEMISIPGRDGEYALDQGHFNNIEVNYRAGIVADSTTDFAEAISNFRNWLASRKGYCRLTDEYNTEEYRMAVFKNAIALEHEGLLTGEFDVTFDCKPQRFLAIGEELVEIGAWGNTETAEGEVVTIDASSDTAVKALTVDIEPVQSGSGTPSPDNVRPISGHDEVGVIRTGKNLQPNASSSGTSNGVTYTVNTDKSISLSGTATGTVFISLGSPYYLRGGKYTISPSGNATIQMLLRKESTSGTTVLDATTSAYTNTIPSGIYAGLIRIQSGTNCNGITLYPQIELGTTATTYEPYNGTDYTTTLPSTTYGGTLDVVSGVLTVDMALVDLSTYTWNFETGGTVRARTRVTDYRTDSGWSGDWTKIKSNAFVCENPSTSFANRTEYSFANIAWNYYNFDIKVPSGVFADATAFTAWLGNIDGNNTHAKLCIPLATPQTYQLTPQQVELLLGENHIFADSGNVTVEYGHNPTLLTNPTWFPSKPLLAVDGYGEIKFNNRSIVNIENATLGDIKQLVNESKALSMTTTFDNAMFNVGDTITVDLSYFNYGAYIIMNASTTPTTSGTVTDSDAHFTTVVTDCVADQGISPSPLYVHVKTTCTPITFTLGTPDTVTNTTEAVVDTQGDKCKWTQTVKYEIDGSGNHKISIKQTLVGASGTNVTTATNMNSNPMILCNSVVAHSTLSILGNPTYIDCDIGEAYMVKDGEPISLNQYIDLGSDLPTLPSGDTEVTYDNTITKVEVKPNWWKV